MVRPIRLAGVACAAALGMFAGGGFAQTPSTPPQQPPAADPQQPVFRTGINFVRVDVIVTDQNGNVVADLEPEDFEVVEEGKPQKIETFKLIKLDGGVAEAAKEPPRAIRTDADEEAEAARDDVRLFAIFLDDYHVRRGSSVAARDAIASFVSTQLGPSDMVGLMYPLESLGSLRMTRDHSAIARGIQQFVGRKFEYTPKNSFEEQYFQYPTDVVEKIRNQVSLSAIRALITHMGSLKEGRKALVLVSEGFTALLPPQMRDENGAMPGSGNPNRYNPSAGMGDLTEERAAWAAGLDLQDQLRDVFDVANKNNVAIYPVDPRGLGTFEYDINERVGLQTDASSLQATLDTLRTLAENTDGRAIVNGNDLSVGLKQIVRDTSSYYLLGYSSTQAPSDGKFHEIRVRVRRPGVQVRSRRGYWALTAEETARALAPPKPAVPKEVTDALASVSVPSRSRIVRTWVGADRGESGKTKMTFVWEPMPTVPGNARATETPARVTLLAVGPDGEPYFRGPVPASAPPRPASGPAGAASPVQAPSRVSFDIPPGKIQLKITVEGAESQVLDSETREIDVPDLAATAETTLGTPAIFKARTVRDFEQLKANPDATPVPGREFSRTDRLLIRVPVYGPGDAPATITARLLNRAGDAIADLPIAAQAATGAPAVIELLPSGLPPGDYLVELKAAGSGGDARQLIGIRITG
jgi:VWFA-related protein